MKKIDTTQWGEFRVGDLFDIHPTKAYQLTNVQLLDNGQYPVVVNSAFNNGVGGYSSQTPTEQGNMITFSDTVDANTIFYQAENFVGYPHVQGLYPLLYKEQWTANSLRFFASMFRKAALTKGFDYGNKFRRDIATEIKVKLPIDAKGNPDWAYMEEYMKALEKRVTCSITALNALMGGGRQHNQINVSKWQYFKMNDLFNGSNTGNVLVRDIEEGSGTIPYVTSSGVNNGVVAYIDASKYSVIKGNCILVGGKTFTLTYQAKDFVSNDSHNIVIHLKSIHGNEYIYLYLISAIKAMLNKKYSWGDAVTKDKLLNDYILLPATANGDPDFEYMEQYMLNVENKVKGTLKQIA